MYINYTLENPNSETEPTNTEKSTSEDSQPFRHLEKDFMVFYDINKGRINLHCYMWTTV